MMTRKLVKYFWVTFNTFAQTLNLQHTYENGLAMDYIACLNPQLQVMKKMVEQVQSSKGWN